MIRRLLLASPLLTETAWPQTAWLQSQPIPRIAFLHGKKPDGDVGSVVGIKEGLRQAGFVDGQNVTFDYRWADNDFSCSSALTAELVTRRPAGIIVGGSGEPAVEEVPVFYENTVGGTYG